MTAAQTVSDSRDGESLNVVERPPEDIIHEGQTFASFEALEEAVREFERATLQKYFKSEARTLVSAAKKGIKRAGDNGSFKYYSCLWLCVRGGKSFCRSRGERKSRTIRIGCPALIRTRISNCGRAFRVVQVIYGHNHGASPEVFHQLQTKQAGVKHDDPQKKSKYIKKKSRLKDNAQAQLRELLSTVTGEGNELSLEESVDKISQLYADDLTVAVDDTNQCVGLSLCTAQMRALWRDFPELLTIESSSYVESLDLANVVHFLVADAMGELRPVMFAILIKSESTLYEWLLQEFVRQHPTAPTCTQICLVGRPYTEFHFVEEIFPATQVLWDPSQSINTFRIRVAAKAVHLSEAGRRAATEHFQKLVFCRSAEMKRVLREDFAAALAVPEAVQACYDHEWEPNYALWNMSRHPYDDAQHEYVLKRMQKLRRYSRAIVQNAAANMYAVFTKIADLYSLLDDLYKGDLLYHIVKVNQSRYQPKTSVDEAEFKYKALVTEFAYMYLKGQFSIFERGLKLMECTRMVTFTRVGDREIKVSTSKDSCTCMAYKVLRLPCAHLLSFRIGSQLDLYSEDLVDERWKRNNIRVEGDADTLVRLPLAAIDSDTTEQQNSCEIKDVQDLEVQIIQEVDQPEATQGEQMSIEAPSGSEELSCGATDEQALPGDIQVNEVQEVVHGDQTPAEDGSPAQETPSSTAATDSRDQILPSSAGPSGHNKKASSTELKHQMDGRRPRHKDASGSALTRAPRQYRERRKKIEELCAELCAVGSGVWGSLFSLRMGVLRDILEAWQDGEEVCVQRVHYESASDGRLPQQLQSHEQTQHPVRDGNAGQLVAVLDTASSASVSSYVSDQQATRSGTPTVLRYNPIVQVKGSQQMYFVNSDDNSVQLVDNYPNQMYTIDAADDPGDDMLMQ
ncbi:uncharacterized protein LOC111260222 [Varroa jacobsoni]|uniref:uncharacterized protein LOC111260222 n=1 Tax=Varroa jacobsoni TaxID=62625 RepID=UPI000BF3EE35|nr:uncharacterized protein LOC111260222 [Varroa jacobsoni]